MGNSLWFCTADIFCGTRSSTTFFSKKPADFSAWHWWGSDSPWRKHGCGHSPVPPLLQRASKNETSHTCFSENSNGLVSQQFLLYFTYVSVSHPLQGSKHMNRTFVQSSSLHDLTLTVPETCTIAAFLTHYPSGTGHTSSPRGHEKHRILPTHDNICLCFPVSKSYFTST